MRKKHLWVQKGLLKTTFQKDTQFLIFFSSKALSNSPKVQLSQNRRKKLTEKGKKLCVENFQLSFFKKTYVDFLIFYLFSGLNQHICHFFQLLAELVVSQSWIFEYFQKHFFSFFGPFHFSWYVFFWTISAILPVTNCRG
jgi:hypothetical protein